MIRLIIVVPFLLALVVFSASNQDPLDMWMLTYSWKCSLGVLALSVGALSFLLGAFCLWVVELRQGRRARKAEQQARDLNAELAQMRAIVANRAPPVVPAPDVQPVILPPLNPAGSEEHPHV
ncbi:MAG: LapA family protein [Acetobacter sp.]